MYTYLYKYIEQIGEDDDYAEHAPENPFSLGFDIRIDGIFPTAKRTSSMHHPPAADRLCSIVTLPSNHIQIRSTFEGHRKVRQMSSWGRYACRGFGIDDCLKWKQSQQREPVSYYLLGYWSIGTGSIMFTALIKVSFFHCFFFVETMAVQRHELASYNPYPFWKVSITIQKQCHGIP